MEGKEEVRERKWRRTINRSRRKRGGDDEWGEVEEERKVLKEEE